MLRMNNNKQKLTLGLLGAIAVSFMVPSGRAANSTTSAPTYLTSTGTMVLLSDSPDVSYDDPSLVIADLWTNVWGRSYVSNQSGMILHGEGPAFTILAGENGTSFLSEGNYYESSRVNAQELNLDVSSIPELDSFGQYLSAGVLTGPSGYSTPVCAMIGTVKAAGREGTVRVFVPFQVSSSISKAVQSVSEMQALFDPNADMIEFTPGQVDDACVAACKGVFRATVSASDTQYYSCLAGCASVATAAGIICLGTTIAFPACLAAVATVQILCNSMCVLDNKARKKLARAARYQCLAGCTSTSGQTFEIDGLEMAFP